ncbi:COQ1 [Cyberlindnera jadinii]|uniref:COQ1 protein n=1 Tax=Cyberlindnera jadinii (strain ATCC 18201 / CBS 1600 / BCRC 20928 / JCM 3617 / NBRC 0987 / NRRL Y-1542) TaxID=983966 RepID=A0A0H5C2W3_CYBJN|nr:terpenoid synthase [Cyberlindnera jadinii NRRL Y-1542]ODV75128.1 terpenoid synthase [Cyberlindnera jadinii NRRL Y-1542]CEP22310.1 COQ1 [Cyberlindnera jadinii]
MLGRSFIRRGSSWSAAVEAAARLVTPAAILKDPISLVSHEMSQLANNIGQLIGSGHPTLNRISAYYFESQGKKIRPLIVLLLSRALSEIPLEQRDRIKIDTLDIPEQPVYEGTKSLTALFAEQVKDPVGPLSPLKILHGINPNVILDPLTKPHESLPEFDSKRGILPKQRRLAEIVEMIHTASLLHDDVIDNSDSRRNRPTGNIAFNNKMAVLAGDFLLGRASVSISRLRNPEVIELLSTSIANLVEGEFMQLKNTVLQPNEDMIEDDTKEIPKPTGVIDTTIHEYSVKLPEGETITHEQNVQAAFEYYIHKTYLKTAALLSKSCRSAAILSGARDDVIENCYQFGRNVGLCFQMIDDVLDYTQTSQQLGKPGMADLKLGLATAPILFAWKENPELGKLISRKFKNPGDVEYAVEQVHKYKGLEKTKELADHHCQLALNNLRSALPESDSRSALEFLTNAIVTRSK